MIKKWIKFLLKKIIFFFKSIKLAKKNIILENNTEINNSKFSKYNRICRNTKFNNSSIDLFSYVGWNSILNNVEIGKFTSIAPFTEVIYGSHPLEFISTHPVFYSTRKQSGISFTDEQLFEEFNYVKGTSKSLIIGNDVWIGYGVKIIEGISIGDGAIILSGAVVTKDVKPYSIVGGVPAKFIKFRFNIEEIAKLEKMKWWDKDINWLKENHKLFINKNSFFSKMKDEI